MVWKQPLFGSQKGTNSECGVHAPSPALWLGPTGKTAKKCWETSSATLVATPYKTCPTMSKLHPQTRALFKEVENLIKLSRPPISAASSETTLSHSSSPEDMATHNYDSKRRRHRQLLSRVLMEMFWTVWTLAASWGASSAPSQRGKPHLVLSDACKLFTFLMLCSTRRLLHHRYVDSSYYKLFTVGKVINTMESFLNTCLFWFH